MKKKNIDGLLLLVCLVLLFSTLSCGEDDIEVAESVITERIEDRPEYNLAIRTFDGASVIRQLIGQNLEGSNWVANSGDIWLSTDLNNEPLGTLRMKIGQVTKQNDGKFFTPVLSATLTTSNVRVGTGAEINGKVYTLMDQPGGCNVLTVIEIGSNFIHAEFDCIVMGKVTGSDEGDDSIAVSGWFIAVTDG